jgi:hypothetical protein
MSIKNEEIDLFDLYNAFKKTRFFKGLQNTIDFIFNNNYWFISLLIIGGIGGYFFNNNKTPIYRSEMIADSKLIDNYSCNQIVLALDTLLNDNNYEELKKLGFTKNILREIKRLEFIYPEQGLDSLKMVEPFRIAIYTTNNKNFKVIEKSVISYLNNNSYSLQSQNIKLEQLKEEKSLIHAEIIAIDSMQLLINNYLMSGAKNNMESSFDPSALIKERKNAKMRLHEIDNNILNINNFVVIKSFTPRTSPEVVNNYYIIKFSFLFFIIGGILLRFIKK